MHQVFFAFRCFFLTSVKIMRKSSDSKKSGECPMIFFISSLGISLNAFPMESLYQLPVKKIEVTESTGEPSDTIK